MLHEAVVADFSAGASARNRHERSQESTSSRGGSTKFGCVHCAMFPACSYAR